MLTSLSLLLSLLASPSATQALPLGRCEARDSSNPGYVSHCGRFDNNPLQCERESQLCVWREGRISSLPPIDSQR